MQNKSFCFFKVFVSSIPFKLQNIQNKAKNKTSCIARFVAESRSFNSFSKVLNAPTFS